MTPVVLAQGMLGALIGLGELHVGPVQAGYFLRIDRAIADRGHPVITPVVSPAAGIPQRASQLKQQVLRSLDDLEQRGRIPKNGRCVILAHSMGGLDARYMLSHLGMNDRVTALVTIATPHRGTTLADWAVRNVDRGIALPRQLARFGLDLRAGYDLTRRSCAAFNQQTLDASGVRYFSVSASRTVAQMSPLLWYSAKLIEAEEGPNDGLVSVASAKWGEHWETWPADHLQTINRNLARPLLRGEEMAPRYLGLLDRLAGLGLLEA